jgi:DNA repair photolyase
MERFEIVRKMRKGKVLAPAHYGCLEGIPTLNVTSGCLFQCAYCYARGYRQAPGKGLIHLYTNLPELLEKELSRKRVIPPWVILNTASDGFQPHPDILNVTYEVVRLLLGHGIGISFLTKGVIPHRFIELMGRFPEKVLAQIGLVSFSTLYWQTYESGTPSPEERLGNILRLREKGILVEVRVDPIIPLVTDTEGETKRLFERLREEGVEKVTLSYLHLRPAIQEQLMRELSEVHQKLIESFFRTQEWKSVFSSTQTKLLPKTLRERGYQRMREIAKRYGIKVSVCQCKNPDLKGDLCSSGRARAASSTKRPVQLPLFRC